MKVVFMKPMPLEMLFTAKVLTAVTLRKKVEGKGSMGVDDAGK